MLDMNLSQENLKRLLHNSGCILKACKSLQVVTIYTTFSVIRFQRNARVRALTDMRICLETT